MASKDKGLFWMISDVSCVTEDESNDAENSALPWQE